VTSVETGYQLIDKPERIIAVDKAGVEICGARRPYGHDHYIVYMTVRLTLNLHQVIATTREAAVEHVRMLAELFVASKVHAA
jgi:hypothetical protein